MNKLKIIFLLTFIYMLYSNCLSQPADTIYYNKEWEQIPSSKGHKYFGIVTKINDSLVECKDYYKNGKLNMIGYYESIELDNETGNHTYYTKKGEKFLWMLYDYDLINDTIKDYLVNKYNLDHDSLEIRYVVEDEKKYRSKGIEINRTRYDYWLFYHRNTSEYSHMVEYKNNRMDGKVVDVFNSIDKVDKEYIGKIHIIGNHKNNKRDGLWLFHQPSGKIYEKRIYKNGKIISKETFY